MALETNNDAFKVMLVDEAGEWIDTVPWPEARERIDAVLERHVYGPPPETLLTAIFTGRAHGA